MDKAALFCEVTRRNALRRANGLPLLDVPAEYAHQVLVAKHRDYQAICDEHADEREAIRQQILAEYREKNPYFGNSTGGRWIVGFLTNKRFTAHMGLTHGLFPPDRRASGHQTRYGIGRREPA